MSETEKAKKIVEQLHEARDQAKLLAAQVEALKAQVDAIPKTVSDAVASALAVATSQLAQRDVTIAALHDQLADFTSTSAVLDAELPNAPPAVATPAQ